MKCLLLEDDVELNSTICEILQIDGYTYNNFFDGKDVYEEIDENIYDLYILDINVPNFNGLEILKYIYSINKNLKVIIMSADLSKKTIEDSYKYGCIDFVKKPFHLSEIRYKLKNIKNEYFSNIELSNSLIFQKKNKQLYKNNSLVMLTKKESKLLNLLIENQGAVVSKDEIIEEVYDNIFTTDVNIRALVKRLRDKMDNLSHIVTISGVGYTLIK